MDQSVLKQRYSILFQILNPKQRRLLVALDSILLGRGSTVAISKASGMSRSTVNTGRKELKIGEDSVIFGDRIRRIGGGRKSLTVLDETLDEDLNMLVSPVTRGDPESPLVWCSKSTRKLATALHSKGHKISHNAVCQKLKQSGFSMQANRKTHEGESHPDRDRQFEYINEQAKSYMADQLPVISVDCKKKEIIGNKKNNGREWEPKKHPTEVDAYDFIDVTKGKAVPYGIYDQLNNLGWVNVGISKDTAEFAVASIRTWWIQMGRELYANAPHLMITADGGGSNSSRSRLWKSELQKFANEFNISVKVCHFPPGTSKWNKIEHQLFSFISMNWRGKPLTSLQVIVNLIGATSSTTGLKVKTSIDKREYKTGIRISDEELDAINLKKEEFHGEWNYTISPI